MEQSLAPEIDLLLTQLRSSDPGDRRMAAAKLGRLDCQDERVRLELESVALSDQDPYLAIEAAYALEKLGFPIQKTAGQSQIERIDRQLERLSSPNKNTRYDACEELRVTPTLPQEAIAALELASNDPDYDVADAASRALLAHKPDETQSISTPANASSSSEQIAAASVIETSAVGKKFGIRAGAYFIDSIIYVVVSNGLMFMVGFVIAVAFAISGRELQFDQQTIQCQDLIINFILFTFYFIVFEWLYGATPGKLILGMRVIRDNGEPCDFKAALIRALLRYIDGLFWGIPAYYSMKHPLYQRFGDESANTIVVGTKESTIQHPREWGWFLVAAILFLALQTIDAIFQIVAMVR